MRPEAPHPSSTGDEEPERMLVLFALGGRRYAAAASDVSRVAKRGAQGVRFWDDTHLGAAPAAGRGLVSTLHGCDEALAVDEIQGMVTDARMHQLPALALACLPDSALAGLIEYEKELLPLVDLAALLQKQVEREKSDGAERGAGERRSQTPGGQGRDG